MCAIKVGGDAPKWFLPRVRCILLKKYLQVFADGRTSVGLCLGWQMISDVAKLLAQLLSGVRGNFYHDKGLVMTRDSYKVFPEMPLLVCPEPSKLKAENQAKSKAAHKVGYAHRLCGETPDVYLTAQGLDHSQTSQERTQYNDFAP